MRYCKKCLIPSTKPYISFDEDGICSACRTHEKKQKALNGIDWKARFLEFEQIVLNAKAKQSPFFDVLVPVSGGKDSITQVSRLLGYNLRILAVNVDYGIKTDIGKQNLNCIPKMGANLMVYTPQRELHVRLIRIGLEDFGDPDLLSHTLLHAAPLHIALKFNIPLVLLGENSAFEYGGSSDLACSNRICRAWFDKYAANNGRGLKFISQKYGIPERFLRMYDYPDEIDSSDKTIAVFMSYYFYWDSEKHYEIARKYGFQALSEPREGTYRTYVGIDEHINRLHQYLKVLKFGYGRATDHACEDIRCGRLTRAEAKELVKKYDLSPLSDSCANAISKFLGYERKYFDEIIESYRNKDIWYKDEHGAWQIKGHLVD